MRRREFLVHAGKVSLVSAAAFNFGCSISPIVDERPGKTALIYGSRYGSTKETAYWVAEGIERDIDVLDVEAIDFEVIIKKYDQFILGSGIWIDGAHVRLMELLKAYPTEIESKIIASFIVCGTPGDDEAGKLRLKGYFKKFHAPLAVKPVVNANFGGRMVIDRLNDKDRLLLDNFYRNVLKRPFINWDRMEPKQAKAFGVELNIVVKG